MARRPAKQSRAAYLAQQVNEVHGEIDRIRKSDGPKRDMAALYNRAHQLRDKLDEELARLDAIAGEEQEEMTPAEFEEALVASLSDLPQDMRRRICDRALGGHGLVVVADG